MSQIEFNRLRRAVNSEGLARTIFYPSKVKFAGLPNTAAYAWVEDRPAHIILRKQGSWKEMIMTLGHEYGHVMDFVRYGLCARWAKVFAAPERSERLVRVSNDVKKALINTELIAENYIPKFLKRFESTVVITEYDLDLFKYQLIQTYRYELIYGVWPPKGLGTQWRHAYKKNPIPVDKSWIFKFDKNDFIPKIT